MDTLLSALVWKQLEASGVSPVARYAMGMAAVNKDMIAVFGGIAQTPGGGQLLSNALWVLNPHGAGAFVTWTEITGEGAPNSLQAQSHLGLIGIGATLVAFGGTGYSGSVDELQQIDLCRLQTCQPGFKVSCNWNLVDEKRGICIPCEESELCCRAATYNAKEGICSGYNITLSSCSPSNSQWNSLLQALAPSFFPGEQECKDRVQEICSSIQSPGLEPPQALENPLLCDKMFLCANDSPFGSSLFAPSNVCGMAGTTCKASHPGKSICCSYIETLIARSCSDMPRDFVRFLAKSRFPSCGTFPSCFDAAELQATRIETVNAGPSCREGMRAAVIQDSRVFMFGGITFEGEYSNELWELQSNEHYPVWVSWKGLRGGPSGRRDAAVTSFGPAGKVLVHGGEGAEFLQADLYVLDTMRGSHGAPYRWADATSTMVGDIPSERTEHTMVGVSATDAFLFGGRTLYGVSKEV